MKNQQFKKALALALCTTTVLSNCVVSYAETPVAPRAALTNLALNKTATSSHHDSADHVASKAVDGDENTRWGTDPKGTDQWLLVDLEKESEIKEFRLLAENDGAQRIGKFKIEGSNDNAAFTVIHQSEDKSAGEGFPQDYTVTLENAVSYRYVRVTVEKLKTGAYPSISLKEFEVRGTADGGSEDIGDQDPNENIALNKTATANNLEDPSLTAAKAVDGDKESKASRWAAAEKPAWLYVDFGKEQAVKTVKLFWERRNASNYEIQIANEAPETDASWTTVASFTKMPEEREQTIVLDGAAKRARYVRLKINEYDSTTSIDGVAWNSVSIYEMEVYGGQPTAPSVTMDSVLSEIQVTAPTADSTKLAVTLPEHEGYDVKYNGTDYEQVIDEDLTIYKPIVDTTVKASFKVTEEATGKYKFREINVTVPGQYQRAEGDNAAPAILPELREWKGHTGSFAFTDVSRIVVPEALKDTADIFAEDYKDLTGKTLEVVVGGTAKAGDVVFQLTTDTTKGLQEEGYLMTVAEDKITVESETSTGAHWATRTILQSLKLTDNVPCGITRDYPMYKVRGFILDVGRKTFTLDYLKQFVKEMSWFKMNDFQVHLNDNLIPLEDYTRVGEDPMKAYSGFRLESDVKEGGNGGKNKQDLTSKDVFYGKDEFREFIQNARLQGVNIVPEIDTPAHSLALTKVRPDLRQGTSGRENDHLALASKYDECLEFVQGIFGEYMDGENPVFDAQTKVHVGADEYSADGNAFRRFCNDMLGYVKDSGRTPRIWGSLTSIKGDGSVPVRGEGAEMNLWNFGWANIDKMYEKGFDLINCNDGNYYIVPAAGYYYDYLYPSTMYNQDINTIGGITIPAGDKQMIGGAFAVWNDMTDYLENGMSEYDIFDRSSQSMSLFAAKLWGKGSMDMASAQAQDTLLGDAPNTNFGYEAPAEEGVIKHEIFDGAKGGVNAEVRPVDGKNALQLKGGESYVETGLTTVGLGNDLRVKVKRTSDSKEEQILFESTYGTIKAVQKETGKVGFSRENHDYSFDYILPMNEWVELEFKNVKDIAKLYVNGKLVDTLGDDDKTSNKMAKLTGNYKDLHATTMFPMERIGSEKNAFIGYVDDVRLGTDAEFYSTMELDHAVATAARLAGQNKALEALIAEAKAVLEKFAPTEEEITALTARIQAAVEAMSFEKADYSRVEQYKALIPEELSVFTDVSVARLQNVLSSIREGLPKSMQSTVDGYEAVLAAALDELELRPAANANYVDNKTVTATASSNQGGEGPEKAIDGNNSSIWHTQYTGAQPPHWINLEMAEPTSVNGVTYVPRQSGTNGNLTGYEIQVSDDGTNFRKIKEGTLESNAQEKVITFDAVTTKHVRVKYVQSVGNFASAAEFKLHLANVQADVAGLNGVIAQAKAIKNENNRYTADSWKALQDKLAEAETLAGSTTPDADDVEVMKKALSKQMTALVLEEADRGEETDKALLEDAVAEYDSYKNTGFEPQSWKKFQDALAAAKQVLKDSNATQAQVEEALNALYKAESGLRTDGGEDEELAAPTGLKVTKTDKTSVEVAWTASDSAGVTGYKVYVDGKFHKEVSETKAVLSDLTAKKEYTITVTAVDGSGNESEASAAVKAVTVDKSALNEAVAKADSVNLDKYKDGALKDAFVTSRDYAKDILAKAVAVQAEIDAAEADLKVKQEALKDALISENPNEDTETPSVPTGLKADKVEKTSIQVSWNASTDNVAVKGYYVYLNGKRLTDENGKDTYVDSTSAAIDGLTAGKEYKIQVAAFDGANNVSALSEILTVKTKEEPKEPVKPSEPEPEPQKPDDSSNPEPAPSVRPAQTGDSVSVGMIAGLIVMLLAAGGAVLVIRRRRADK